MQLADSVRGNGECLCFHYYQRGGGAEGDPAKNAGGKREDVDGGRREKGRVPEQTAIKEYILDWLSVIGKIFAK